MEQTKGLKTSLLQKFIYCLAALAGGPYVVTIGNYRLFGQDSLVFMGKDGQDSVYWSLKKSSK